MSATLKLWLTDNQAMAIGAPFGSFAYIVSFDVDAMHGLGAAQLTLDPDEAMTWVSPSAAFEAWRTQSKVRPFRGDGKPNRPLTAYSAEIEQRP